MHFQATRNGASPNCSRSLRARAALGGAEPASRNLLRVRPEAGRRATSRVLLPEPRPRTLPRTGNWNAPNCGRERRFPRGRSANRKNPESGFQQRNARNCFGISPSAIQESPTCGSFQKREAKNSRSASTNRILKRTSEWRIRNAIPAALSPLRKPRSRLKGEFFNRKIWCQFSQESCAACASQTMRTGASRNSRRAHSEAGWRATFRMPFPSSPAAPA